MSDLKAFRASPETAAAIAAAAEREGVSQSEIIRSAVEARLGVGQPEQEPDVYELIVGAGKGELQAQRDLIRMALTNTLSCIEAGMPQFIVFGGYTEALLMARLAAAHGNESDQAAVVQVLALMGQYCPDFVSDGDAFDIIGRLDMMADAGVPYAADALASMMDAAPADTVQQLRDGGKAVRSRLRDEMGVGQ